MLPYVRVRYEFSAQKVSAPSITYYGCIMGKATRLHDLVSKKYFTPGTDDCGGGATEVIDYDMTYVGDPIIMAPYEYPKLISGNTVDADSVKAYIKDLVYVGMYEKSGEAAIAASQYIGIPCGDAGDKSQVRLAVVDEDPLDISDDVTISATTVGSDDFLDIVVGDTLNSSSGKYLIPGTVCISFKTDNRDVVLSDFAAVEDVTTVSDLGVHPSEAPITGVLRVYSDDDTDFVVDTNTLTVDYETGVISGILRIKTADALETDAYVKEVRTAEPADLANVLAVDDYFILSRRAYTGSVGSNPVGLSGNVVAGLAVTGGVTVSFTGTEADMEMSYIRAEFTEDVDDQGPQEPESRCMFQVSSVDYDTAIIYGASGNVYDTMEDKDYRIHMSVIQVAQELDDLDRGGAYRRLVEGDHFDIVAEGSTDVMGQLSIDPSTLIIKTRVRDDGVADATYAADYDDDPELYQDIIPEINTPNFISGSLRVEYEENVVANQIVDILFRLNDVIGTGTEQDLIDIIGQYDPRNMLGFAVGFTRELSTVNFYILPESTVANALIELKKNRFIFHVWNVSTSPSVAFSNWITTENQPKQSRFRIGYESAYMPDDLEKVAASADYSGIMSVDKSTYRRKFTSDGINYLNLGVAPGDNFNVPDSTTEYEIQFVSKTAITFVERFTRQSDYATRKMTDQGSLWDYAAFPAGFDPLTVTVKLKVRSKATPPVVDHIEGYVLDLPSDPAVTSCVFNGTTLELVLNTAAYDSIATPAVAVVPVDENLVGFSIDRTLNATEKTNYMVGAQSIENPDYVCVLSKDILFKTMDAVAEASTSYDAVLPNYATAGIIFAAKITLVPHMPLTEVFFDTSNSRLGRVTGFQSFDRDEHLELLGDAGYCMLSSDGDTKPYCLSDFTTGYKIYKETDRGLLSKITPVRLYGKDVYETTKRFKGPYNTGTPELLSLINVHLIALKDKYTTISYSLLGTLLKNVAAPSVAFDGSFVTITHRISSQDPSRYIDNIVYVE